MTNSAGQQKISTSRQLLLDQVVELYQKKKFVEAEEKLKQILDEDPNNLAALIHLAHIARSKGNHELAVSRFQDILEKHPKHWRSYINIAIELRILNDYRKAEEKLNFVLQNCPDTQISEDARTQLSLVQQDVLRKENILQGFEDSIEDINLSLVSALEKVIKLREFKYLKVADGCLEQLLGNLLKMLEIYYENRGDIYYYQQADKLKALKEYRNAESISVLKQPQFNINIIAKMANLLCSTGQENEWEEMRREMLIRSPIYQEIRQIILDDFPSIDLEDYLILIILPPNVGDPTAFLSVLKQVSIKFNKKVILFMWNKPQLIDIYHLFQGEHILKCYFVNISKYHVPELQVQPIQPGIPACLGIGPHETILPGKTSPHFKHTGFHFDIYKRNSGLQSSAEISYPQVDEVDRVSAIERFNRYGLHPKKTVLIAPLSNSINQTYGTNETFKAFWENAYSLLIKNGFCIALNGVNQGQISLASGDYTVVDVPLSQIIPFVEYGGFFMGARSGLCDLLGFAQCSKKVIYPFGHPGQGLEYLGYEEYVVNPNDYNVENVLSNWLTEK